MKKLLALVLALVMVMGLSVVGANAATYSDADSITYKEAVDVMSAVGVLGGSDGKFDPTGSLTREQGAKIITYMLMGGNAKSVDALSVSTAPFDDVAADRWSAGSIAYCKATGILGGVGDNKFQPEAPLTGAAFAKMCLVALGYDANREGLVGGDWTLNVARLVNAANLAEDVPVFGYNTQLTRQDAAQIAFNTMKATMQEYTGGLTADRNGNLTAGRGPARNGGYDYRTNGVGGGGASADTNMQFVENYFPTLKCYNTSNNAYGQPVHKWYIGLNRDDKIYTAAKATSEVVTSDTKGVWTTDIADVTNAQLYAMFDTTNGATTPCNITVWENGQNAAVLSVAKNDNATKALGVRFKGAKVEAVDTNNDGFPNRLEVTYGYLAKVTKVDAATSSAARKITFEAYNNATKTTGHTFTTDEFAKDDYIMVYPKLTITAANGTGAAGFTDANIIEIKAAESVNGTLSTVTGTSGAGTGTVTALTVGGTKYTVAANNADNAAAYLATLGTADGNSVRQSAYTLNKGYTLYLSNGFVIGVKGDSASYEDYVYVVSSSATSDGFTAYNNIYYVTQDGVTHTAKAITAPATAGWYAMDEDSSNAGYYTFGTGAGTAVTGATVTVVGVNNVLKSTQPTVATGVVANDKTLFVLRTGASTFKVYTGISNVPSYQDTAGTLTSNAITDGTYAKLVYIDFSAGTASKVDSGNETPIYLLKNTYSSSTYIDGKTYYVYDAIVNGEKTTITSTKNTGLTAGLVTTTTNSDGYVTATTAVSTTGTKYAEVSLTGGNAIAYSAPTLNANGTYFTLAANAVVYYADSADSYKLTVGTGEDIVGTVDGAGDLWVIYKSSSDLTVETVYFAGSI